jgi:uncharacterized protein YbjQ (UPF0145 family)
MGLFDALRGGPDDDPEAERRREEDVERVEQGSIPLAAEQRLRELASGAMSFTSGLSVADFALCRQAGVRPVAQVMGSSIYKVGWQSYPWSNSWQANATTVELEALTNAWNDARSRALRRLAEEAELAGCHAVVDVTFESREHEFLSDEIEVVVNGTAVVLDGAQGNAKPVLTDLSLPDYVLLRRAGYEPVGIVTATSVVYVVPGQTARGLTTGFQLFQPNQEVVDFTQGVYQARELALGRANHEAWRSGATTLVGLSLDQHVARREVEQNGSHRIDLIVTFHVVGTGIALPGEYRPIDAYTVIRQGAAPS